MKWKSVGLVASPLALAFVLGACGSEQSATPAPTQSPSAAPDLPVMGEELRIVALGDSLFAGYGLEPGQSYPARLEAALRARGLNARITNAGVSGDTTAGGLGRLDFTLNSLAKPPALVIISLGGNDIETYFGSMSGPTIGGVASGAAPDPKKEPSMISKFWGSLSSDDKKVGLSVLGMLYALEVIASVYGGTLTSAIKESLLLEDERGVSFIGSHASGSAPFHSRSVSCRYSCCTASTSGVGSISNNVAFFSRL